MSRAPIESCLDALFELHPNSPIHELSECVSIMERRLAAGDNFYGALKAAETALDAWEQERRERQQAVENTQRYLRYVHKRPQGLRHLPQLRRYMARHFQLHGAALTAAVRKAAIVLRNGGSPGAALYHAVNLQETI